MNSANGDVILSMSEFGNPSGSPIVGLHGGGSTRYQWRRIATEGLPQLRWICPDLRGHGDSPSGPPWAVLQIARDVVTLLDSIGIESADLIGSSMGGQIAIEVARRFPQRVRSVVLLDPPMLTRQEFLQFQNQDERSPARSLWQDDWQTVEDALTEIHAASKSPQKLPENAREQAELEVRAMLERTGTEAFRMRVHPGTMKLITDELLESLPPTIGSFPGSVLLLISRHMGVVSEDGRQILQSELGPRLTSIVLDAGHALLWDAFDETTALVARFLRSGVGDDDAVVG